MRIFIGCEEIAANLKSLAFGFRELGHQVTSFAFRHNAFYKETNYSIQYVSPIRKVLDYQSRKLPKMLGASLHRVDSFLTNYQLRNRTESLIRNHDLFIFIWRPWLHEQYLFPLLHAAKKPIICLHMGSDVRHISAYKQQFGEDVSLWESFFHQEDINVKINTIRLHEKYASLIYSVPDQAGLYIRPYNHIFMAVQVDGRFKFNITGRNKPVLLHIPSRTGIKGTKYIVEAINILRDEGIEFEFNMLSGVPQADVITALNNADILVDELLLHGPGALSAEAMACGCAVATRTLGVHEDIFSPPVVSITPNTIVEKLRQLITDKTLRIQLAKDAKAFFDSNNTPTSVAQRILNDIDNEENGNEYTPDFFIQRYRLPDGVRLTNENLRLGTEVANKYYKGSTAMLTDARSRGLIE